jgi:membrane-associated phospholipid phosphatase
VLAGVLGVVVAALLVDAYVAAWVGHARHALLDALVGVLNPVGSGVTLLVACTGLALACRWLERPRLHDAAWLAALAFASAGLLEFTIKHLVGRPRPDAGLPGVFALGPTFAPDLDSFPSGHATSVFAVATVFAAFYPRLATPLYGLAAVIALGRVYLERHYVSDILAGVLIGVVIAAYLVRHRAVVLGWIGGPARAPVD